MLKVTGYPEIIKAWITRDQGVWEYVLLDKKILLLMSTILQQQQI